MGEAIFWRSERFRLDHHPAIPVPVKEPLLAGFIHARENHKGAISFGESGDAMDHYRDGMFSRRAIPPVKSVGHEGHNKTNVRPNAVKAPIT
jgi:hypothetical protein